MNNKFGWTWIEKFRLPPWRSPDLWTFIDDRQTVDYENSNNDLVETEKPNGWWYRNFRKRVKTCANIDGAWYDYAEMINWKKTSNIFLNPNLMKIDVQYITIKNDKMFPVINFFSYSYIEMN